MKHREQLSRTHVRINAVSVAKIMAAMLGGSASMAELKDVTGMSHNTILSYIRAMRKEGVCHIAKWEKDCTGRTRIARHAIGRFPDAPKKLKPRAEIERNRRARVRFEREQEAISTGQDRSANAGDCGSHQSQ